MPQYLLKRVLIFIPTLLVITLVAFAVSLNAPGDPVLRMVQGAGSETGMDAERQASEKEYFNKRAELGLDLPVFYFSLTTLSQSDTLYKILRLEEQESLSRLTHEYGNWEQVIAYHHQLKALEDKVFSIEKNPENSQRLIDLKNNTLSLRRESDPRQIKYYLNKSDSLCQNSPSLSSVIPAINKTKESFQNIEDEATPWKTYIPAIHFFGFNNQYHNWMSRIFLHFDFGKSYQDNRQISSILPERLLWTLVINLIAIFLSYLISIPMGVLSARYKNTLFDKISSTGLFILYSLPSFWVATMLILFLCNPEYLKIFPPVGVQDIMHSPDWPLTRKLADWGFHLVLPIFCYTYGSFAFLSRQMRSATLENIGQDYVRTARAKGLSERVVLWKHAFRNSLIPLITMLASILPAMVGGSIILERIFTIPGMGTLIMEGIYARDYPLIIAVFTFTAVLTLVGVLLADLLYAVVDPRISYK